MTYAYSVQLHQPMEDAINTLKEVLMTQHLGIVSDVDVSGIIKNKLNESMPGYRILGACNPKMAKTMIEAVPDIGTLLPCTIVAREEGNSTRIDFMDPVTVLGIANNAVVNGIAEDADKRLKAVVSQLEQ